MLALDRDVPIAYQSFSTVAGPSLSPILSLRSDQIFCEYIFSLPSLRGRGLIGQPNTAASHLLLARGFRERWWTVDRLNHASADAFFRGSSNDRVGTLTRTSRLGRVRFSFVPTTRLSTQRIARPLELLTAIRGPVSRVALLLNPASVAGDASLVEETKRATETSTTEFQLVTVRETASQAEAFRDAMSQIAKAGADGMLVLHDPMFAEQRRAIVALAETHRLATVYEGARFAEAGGLIACRPPAPPVEGLPTPLRRLSLVEGEEHDLVINRKTARTLGLTIPSSPLSRADQVIE
ncbi:MAG: hypothetical protein ACREJ9_13795 [Candidatus Rokuibacteriota bacterium]